MESKLDALFSRFSKKGFSPVEIPELLKDAVQLIGNKGEFTITAVDRELEELGWGFGVMDNETYTLITALARSVDLSDAASRFSDTYLKETHDENRRLNLGE